MHERALHRCRNDTPSAVRPTLSGWVCSTFPHRSWLVRIGYPFQKLLLACLFLTDIRFFLDPPTELSLMTTACLFILSPFGMLEIK